MPIYILQALNTETCLNCLWWLAWWFVTNKLRATWTLSWNMQTKATGNFEGKTKKNTHLFQSFSNNLYRTHLISSNNKRDVLSKTTPPFFFKVTDATHVHGSPQYLGMAAIIWKPFYAALTHGEDEGMKSLPCHTCCRTRVSWYTSTGVGYF